MLFTPSTFFVVLSTAVAAVSGHGHISSPARRAPGQAYKASCGNTAYSVQSSDQYGPVQGLVQMSRDDSTYNPATCNFHLCKGYKYDDNKNNVQRFSAGQAVNVRFEIRAPHPGTANMSVIDTTSNRMIGTPLKTFSSFASTNGNQAELNWSFTMSNVNGQCATAGKCVLQFWWDSRLADQTYTSCVDFTQ